MKIEVIFKANLSKKWGNKMNKELRNFEEIKIKPIPQLKKNRCAYGTREDFLLLQFDNKKLKDKILVKHESCPLPTSVS